jgi:UDP-N-acetylmuramoyl-L-alanyl-D-glutamate--2,6-diaminopimelate ligase
MRTDLMTLRKMIGPGKPLPPSLKGTEPVSGVTADSRQVLPGSVFVAVTGTRTDGLTFVDEAVHRGALLIVADKPCQAGVPVLQVDDCREALALLARSFYEDPARSMDLIGVTGTNGKSTVTFLIEELLEKTGRKPGLLGTLVYRWGGMQTKAARTTPDAVDIYRMLRQMADSGVDSVVMEVSSHGLDQKRVFGLNFRAAVFTNLSRDHLDYHKDIRAYGEAKARLFRQLSRDGIGVVNCDDPGHVLMLKNAEARVITFGESKSADYRIRNVKPASGWTRFYLDGPHERSEVETSLLGRFNAWNWTAAAVTGMELGVPRDSVLHALRQVNPVPGRMERVETSGEFQVIVDYAHSPGGLQSVLETVREWTARRIILVFGCGGERDRGKRPEMGKIGAKLADRLIVTSDNPRNEDPEKILDDIFEGIDDLKRAERIKDRHDAICRALALAGKGDTVLIAGRGHESVQDLGDRKVHFLDREVVEACLQGASG